MFEETGWEIKVTQTLVVVRKLSQKTEGGKKLRKNEAIEHNKQNKWNYIIREMKSQIIKV